MKLLLGSVWSPRWGREKLPILATYQLAGIARAQGYDVDVLDPSAPRTAQASGRELHGYDLIGLSANSFTWPETLTWIQAARAHHPDIPIVLGGVHPSFCDEHCLRVSGASFVVRLEGEAALVALCEYIEGRRSLAHVPNLTYLDRDGNVVRNEQGPMLSKRELEDLPLPALDLVPAGVYQTMPIESARGCAYNCWFCGITYRQRWRGLSTRHVMRAVDHALSFGDRFLGRRVFFADDCFSIDPKRTIEIWDELRDNDRGASYCFEVRIRDVLRMDAIRHLDDVPCSRCLVGVESGYDAALERMGKYLTIAETTEFARRVRNMSFRRSVWWSYIIGFPWETLAEIKQTVEFAFRTALLARGSIPSLCTFSVLPGSMSYDDVGTVAHSHYDRSDWDQKSCQYCDLTRGERRELDAFLAAWRNKFQLLQAFGEQGWGGLSREAMSHMVEGAGQAARVDGD